MVRLEILSAMLNQFAIHQTLDIVYIIVLLFSNLSEDCTSLNLFIHFEI